MPVVPAVISFWLWIPIGLLTCWLAGALIWELGRPANTMPITPESALEAVKLMKDWGVWMAGIATGAMAANGVLISKTGMARNPFAEVSVLSFAVSVLMDAWLLGSLPSIVSRLSLGASPGNDIYEMSIFGFLTKRVFRLGFIGNVQHTFFVLAVYTFGLAVIGYVP